MPFFDDRDDPPRRRPAPPSGAATADRQTLVVRRTVAAGVAVVLLVLLVLGVRGCFQARKEQAYENYVRDITSIVQQSNQESKTLFGVLTDPGKERQVGVENQVNTLRSDSERLVDQAGKVSHPGGLDEAQGYLVEALRFRRDGIRRIADTLPQALGKDNRQEAIRRIAAQMQQFVAGDVVYSQRFIPSLEGKLRDENLLERVQIPGSRFLSDFRWLRTATVRDRLSGVAGGAGGPVAPGTHGTGLGPVTVQPSGRQLSTDTAADIPAGEDISFEVQVENQGENDETEVIVKLTLKDAGEPIEVEDSIPSIAAGETQTVTIPLANTPPTGRPVTVEVEVEAVPGEESLDNNKGSFPAIFTTG